MENCCHKAMKTCLNSYNYVWISWQTLRLNGHIPGPVFESRHLFHYRSVTRFWIRKLHILLCCAKNIGCTPGFIFHCDSQLFAQGTSFTLESCRQKTIFPGFTESWGSMERWDPGNLYLNMDWRWDIWVNAYLREVRKDWQRACEQEAGSDLQTLSLSRPWKDPWGSQWLCSASLCHGKRNSVFDSWRRWRPWPRTKENPNDKPFLLETFLHPYPSLLPMPFPSHKYHIHLLSPPGSSPYSFSL